jgi:5-methylthioadenosine/S-adenosylhomocysteine deaminase
MAEHYGVPLHVHLAETEWEHQEIRRLYGKSPVRFLDSLGVLSERTLAAHCVWVEGGEIELLAKRKVGVAHCPKSNLKLASGIAPVARMLEEGVRVCLGTDGAASNNTLDILAEASLAARLHKAASGDPTVLSAPEVLKMATLWGAQSLGLADRVGTIQVGKEADLLLLGLSAPHLTPLYNIHSHLVYAARASDVRAVLVRGKVLVNDGKLLSADEGEILEKARWWARRIRSL